MWYAYQLVNLIMLYIVYGIIFSDSSRFIFSAIGNELINFFSLSPTGVAAEEGNYNLSI